MCLSKTVKVIIFFGFFMLLPKRADAMHIMEGFLPLPWAVFWSLLSLPFLVIGVRAISRRLQGNPQLKLLFGAAGAFTFILSALKIPSVTGSSSHPTGIGLGAILFGPWAMSVLGAIVLLFQALLLAHGGITTLGANIFSMAVVGPFAAYAVFRLGTRLNISRSLVIFTAAFIGDLATYVTTSIQLALAFPADIGGYIASAAKFLSIFALTQIPLALSEGLLTVMVFNFLHVYSKQELFLLNIACEQKGRL